MQGIICYFYNGKNCAPLHNFSITKRQSINDKACDGARQPLLSCHVPTHQLRPLPNKNSLKIIKILKDSENMTSLTSSHLVQSMYKLIHPNGYLDAIADDSKLYKTDDHYLA